MRGIFVIGGLSVLVMAYMVFRSFRLTWYLVIFNIPFLRCTDVNYFIAF